MEDHFSNNLELLARILAGDDSARDDLFQANKGLVRTIAGNFNWQGPAPKPSYDDLCCYGEEGLNQGCQNVHRIKHSNVCGYLTRWIWGRMLRLSNQNHPLHKIHRKRKGEKKKRYIVNIPDDYESPDEQGVVDLWDLILSCCHDDKDRKIVTLRKQKETNESISKEIGLCESRIAERLQEIEDRLRDKMEELRK
jgi:RNA polymerase sigma factor (sigma-70 family)